MQNVIQIAKLDFSDTMQASKRRKNVSRALAVVEIKCLELTRTSQVIVTPCTKIDNATTANATMITRASRQLYLGLIAPTPAGRANRPRRAHMLMCVDGDLGLRKDWIKPVDGHSATEQDETDGENRRNGEELVAPLFSHSPPSITKIGL